MFAFGVLAGMGEPASGQLITSEPFASHLVGEWRGEGIYDGNWLTLSREWTSELGGHFLKVDMRVTMANGASFGALMYWTAVENGHYQAFWMDGAGRAQGLQGLLDPDSHVLSANFLDEFSEEGAEWRRWEFEGTGTDSYVERLFRRKGNGWELLAEFEFDRIYPSADAPRFGMTSPVSRS